MARGPYAKTAARRRSILATAREVFAESGFRGASVREVAARAGMTDSGILHHFGGKVHLLLEVVKEKEAEDTVALHDPYMRDIVRRNTGDPGTVRLFTTLSAEATDPDHPAHEHFVTRYAHVRELLVDRLAAERARGAVAVPFDPDIAARLLIAVMDGLQIQWLLDPSLDMDVAYQDLIEHYFGVGPADDATT